MKSTKSPSSGRLTAVMLRISSLSDVMVIAEFGLRFANREQYFAAQPNSLGRFQLFGKSIPGVVETAMFKTSARGIHSVEFAATDNLRILGMGVTTTKSILFDTQETWMSGT